jgi:ATP-dependent Clp protease protease subunit
MKNFQYDKAIMTAKVDLFNQSNLSKFVGIQRMITRTKVGVSIPGSPPPDLPSLLLDQRIVYIGSPLTSRVTELLIGELLWLNFTYPEKDIDIYINSIGSQNIMGEALGSDSEAFAILDTLRYIRPAYRTLCVGNAFGNAAMLLASGKKGMRDALPNARIMTCPPRFDRSFGRLTDQIIRAEYLEDTSKEFVETLAAFTGRDNKEILKATSRNKYWTPESAIQFGIIDRVVKPKAHKFVNLRNHEAKWQSRSSQTSIESTDTIAA